MLSGISAFGITTAFSKGKIANVLGRVLKVGKNGDRGMAVGLLKMTFTGSAAGFAYERGVFFIVAN